MNIILTTVLLAALARSDADLTTTENLNFVDVLKHNLRRNNDDYIESTTTNTTTSTKNISKILSTIGNESTGKSKDKYNSLATAQRFYYKKSSFNNKSSALQISNKRRSFNEIGEKVDNLAPNLASQSDVRRANVVATTSNSAETETLTTVKPAQTASNNIPVEASQANDDTKLLKINKLKKFVKKNKQRFDVFMNKKKAETQMSTEAQTEPTMAVNIKRKWYASSDERLVRQRAFSSERLPANDLLDMAPANGGKIHGLRLKNRLCQRSVLLPEGPKYDSGGRMYLGAYTHKWGRDYSMTRRPHLVLPRCCNCCKKSVLGCE